MIKVLVKFAVLGCLKKEKIIIFKLKYFLLIKISIENNLKKLLKKFCTVGELNPREK